MAGTLGDIFTGPGAPAPPPPTNQVFRRKFNDQEPFARRAFPDDATVAAHQRIMEATLFMDDFDPPSYMGLDPDGDYIGPSGGLHGPGKIRVLQLASEGKYVAPVALLVRALASIPDVHRLVPGEVYHSHWEGIKGGAESQLCLVNTGLAATLVGAGGAHAVINADDVAFMLSKSEDDQARKDWLLQIHRELATPK